MTALRIIPALAGNTLVESNLSYTDMDHPRSRGEYSFSNPMGLHENGSSPLSRGIPICPTIRPCGMRIIPALAGNTAGYAMLPGRLRDHPRSRGEYVHMAKNLPEESGSSPLSRGIHEQTIGTLDMQRIIPALAGNTGP